MKFMIIRKADEATEAGGMPTAELMKSMMDYNRELADAGVLRAGAGLHPSSKGARVTFPAGNPTVLDGPFSETKELIAGYTILNADSKEAVIEMVKDFLRVTDPGRSEIFTIMGGPPETGD